MKIKISITKGNHITDRYKMFYSGSEWFDSEFKYVIKDDGECFSIVKKNRFYEGKSYSISNKGTISRIISNISLGVFYSDEDESNEDELFFYYND